MSTHRPPNPPNRPDNPEWPPKQQRPGQSPQEPPYSSQRDFSPFRPDQPARMAERPNSPFPERTVPPPELTEIPPAAPVMPSGKPEHTLADLRLPPSAKIRLFSRPAKQGGRGGWLTFLLVLLALVLAGAALGLSLREPEDNTRDEVLKVMTEQGGTAQGRLATAASTETQAAFEAGRTQTLSAMTSTAAAQTQAQTLAPTATATGISTITPPPSQTEEQTSAEVETTAEVSENAGQQAASAPTNTPAPTSSPTAKPSNTPPPPTSTPTAEPIIIQGKISAEAEINVRSGPGTRYKVEGKLTNRAEIQVLGTNNGENYFNNSATEATNWYKIKVICAQDSPQGCEYEGWIASDFVELDDETQAEQIPVLKAGVDYEPPA